jgi:hypothetical protein
MEGRFDLVLIRKQEALIMREKGLGEWIKSSHSRSKHYYAVEEENVLEFLSMYRSLIIVK